MTAEQWQRLKEVFAEALEKDAPERDEFVAQVFDDDPELLAQARRLLASYDDAGDFLSNPAMESSAGREPSQLFAPGQVVAGRFRITGFIARGGMGEVYEAEDLTLSTRVALKTIQPRLRGEHALELFKQEILSARQVTHPNVCRIYDIAEHGAEGGGPAVTLLTMELLEGPTLSRRLKDCGPFSRREALPLIHQISAGLQAAHDAGVIHRDFKSGNVILIGGPNGLRPVITDFGLALPAGSRPESRGAHAGTPGYMAPEQLAGAPATAATDVYALGVVVAKMIGGALPSGAEEPPAGALPDSDRESKKLGSWRRVIARCTEQNPAKRYQRPAEVATALHRSSGGPRRRLAALAAAAAVAGMFATVWFATDKKPVHPSGQAQYYGQPPAAAGPVSAPSTVAPRAEPTDQAPFRDIEVTRLTTVGQVGEMSAISPDGAFVAYVRVDSHQQSLWVKRLDTGDDIPLIPPRETVYSELAFSPDSRRVRYGECPPGAIYEMPLLGGAARKLSAALCGNPWAAYSSDDRRRVFSQRAKDGGSELVVAALNGSETKTKTIAIRPPGFTFGALGWSPDGRTIACEERGFLNSGQRIVWISAVGAPERTTISEWTDVPSIAWLPNGRGILVNAQGPHSNEHQVWEVSYPRGDVRRITHDVNNYWGRISLSSDGRTAVVARRESDSGVWVTHEGSASQAARITSDRSLYDGGVAWMPDGRLVYSASRHTPGGGMAYDLWLAQSDGSSARRLMADGINIHPRACPDGKSIVFHHNDDEKTGIWSVDTTTGSTRPLTDGGNFPDCSAAGWVVYTIPGGASLGVWRVPLQGGETVRLTTERAFNPIVSPDGATVAYSYGGGFADFPIDGTRPPRKHDGIVESIRWESDGRAVIALRSLNDKFSAWRLPLDDSAPRQLTQFQSAGISRTGWDWSRFGLTYVQTDTSTDLVLIRDQR